MRWPVHFPSTFDQYRRRALADPGEQLVPVLPQVDRCLPASARDRTRPSGTRRATRRPKAAGTRPEDRPAYDAPAVPPDAPTENRRRQSASSPCRAGSRQTTLASTPLPLNQRIRLTERIVHAGERLHVVNSGGAARLDGQVPGLGRAGGVRNPASKGAVPVQLTPTGRNLHPLRCSTAR